MKNYIIGINAILVLAVAFLFYAHFSNDAGKHSHAQNVAGSSNGFKIAYFETDSIQSQFEYFKEVSSELQAKDQTNQKVLMNMKNSFAQKYQELQKVANSLSQAELANKQQELLQLEKAYQGKEKMIVDEMQDEQFRKMQDVRKKIQDYLKEYNKDKGYAFILSSTEDLMYLKDSTYNITQDVVNGLNKIYRKK